MGWIDIDFQMVYLVWSDVNILLILVSYGTIFLFC